MNVRTLKALLKRKGWSQSELARQVGVSRQAVSLWFQRDEVNLQSRHLIRLGRVLGSPVEDLTEPLPCFDPEMHARTRTALLWDRLYPDLDDFALALNSGDPRALARFVEVYGLFAAEKTLGPAAWTRFPDYRRLIHPARRRELETLWEWHKDRTAA
jgi:transcriptional regulator with XRE-family HTH domain